MIRRACMLMLSLAMGMAPLASAQPAAESDVVQSAAPAAGDYMAGFEALLDSRGIAWSPLGGRDHLMVDRPEILKIAEKHGKTGAQVIIRWHLDTGNIVIPKSVKQQRILENAQVFDFHLDAEDLAAIAAMDTNQRSYWSPDRWDEPEKK